MHFFVFDFYFQFYFCVIPGTDWKNLLFTSILFTFFLCVAVFPDFCFFKGIFFFFLLNRFWLQSKTLLKLTITLWSKNGKKLETKLLFIFIWIKWGFVYRKKYLSWAFLKIKNILSIFKYFRSNFGGGVSVSKNAREKIAVLPQ